MAVDNFGAGAPPWTSFLSSARGRSTIALPVTLPHQQCTEITCRLQRFIGSSTSITTHLCLVLQTFLKAVQQFVKEVQAGGPLAKGAKSANGDAAAAASHPAAPAAANPSTTKKAAVRGGFCSPSCARHHCVIGFDARLYQAS